MGLFSRKPRNTARLRITPPEPAPDRHGIGIAAIFRDEGRYIAEWVRYHEIAGVRAFYLYDDGSTDDGPERAKQAAQDASVTIIPWGMRIGDATQGNAISAQTLALAHALSVFGGDLRWMAMVDIDEFLVPLASNSIGEALSELDAHPAITLPWTMFGRSGHQTPPVGGIVGNYLRRWDGPKSMRYVGGSFNAKSIVDPTRVDVVHVHRTTTGAGEVAHNDAGEPVRMRGHLNPNKLTRQALQLNHYFTRSEEDVLRKIAKGGDFATRNARAEGKLRNRIEQIEADEVQDTQILDFLDRRGAMDSVNYRKQLAALGRP